MAFTTYNNQELTLSGVWDNSAVAYTRLKVDVQDLNSSSTSNLLDLQNSGISRFKVFKNGNVQLGTGNGAIYFNGTSYNIYQQSNYFHLRSGSSTFFSQAINEGGYTSNSFWINNNSAFFGLGTSYDVKFYRDAAAILALRDGNAAQSFRIYNNFLATSSYERAAFNWNASAFEIETEASGLGLARDLILGTSSIPRITIASTGELTFNSSAVARTTNIHGRTEIHNYAGGYPSTPQNALGNSIRVTGYQGTNASILPILQIKDYRNTHWNNFGAGMGTAGISFVFENGNNAGTPIAEKTIGAIYTIQDSASRMDSAALAFAANGTTERMRISSGGNVGIGLTSPSYRLHIAASSYPVLYASGTTTDASAQYTFETNGKLAVGTTNGTFGEKIRFNNGYGIETFSGGGIRIRGGAYVSIADNTPFDGAYFSPGYFGIPSLDIRSKFETQVLLQLQQQSFSAQTDDYFRIRKLTSTGQQRILTVASSGWMGIGTSGPSGVLTVADTTSSGLNPLLDLSQTWNTTSAVTALKLNVSDAASNSASLLLDLQVTGSSKFSVRKDGQTSVSNLRFNGYGASNNYYLTNVSNGYGWYSNGITQFGILGNVFIHTSVPGIVWTTDPYNINNTANTRLALLRDADNIFAQRNGTNSQKFRLYNTFDSAASSFEAMEFGHKLYDGKQYQYISAITSGTGAANIGIAIAPASAGSFSLAVPDGTAVGGNNRGTFAVDLQIYRTLNTQIPEGSASFAAGSRNRVTAQNGIAMGDNNSVTGSAYAVAIGYNNRSTGQAAVTLGETNVGSGQYSFTVGYANTAEGRSSVALGERAVSKKSGHFVYANGGFGNDGNTAQYALTVIRGQTTSSVSSVYLTQIDVESAKTVAVELVVVAREASGLNHAMFKRMFLMERTGNTSQIIGTVQTVGTDIGSNAGSPPTEWSITVSINDSTDKLLVECKDTRLTTDVRWVGQLTFTEAYFA